MHKHNKALYYNEDKYNVIEIIALFCTENWPVGFIGLRNGKEITSA